VNFDSVVESQSIWIAYYVISWLRICSVAYWSYWCSYFPWGPKLENLWNGKLVANGYDRIVWQL